MLVPQTPPASARRAGGSPDTRSGSGGSELARYPFTPEEMHSGPDNPAGGTTQRVALLSISELVPYVDGTVWCSCAARGARR